MTTQPADQPGGLTRRHLIAGGAAAAAGAAVLGTALGSGSAGAAAPQAVPQALDPAITGLTYKSLDAAAFDVYGNEGEGVPATGNFRFFQDVTGVQPLFPKAGLYANLDLPVGAVIKQINSAYQTQPIVSIRERNFATGAITDVLTPTSLPASPGGIFASSLTVAPNVVIKPNCSYALKFYCGPGTSIAGAAVGYSPAAFGPITPQRVLDTRPGAGGSGKLQPGQEVVIDLSSASPFGSAAVLNITADSPDSAGFLSAYSADIAFPNTSVLNFSPVQANIANGAIVTMGAGNKVKVRAGDGAVNVIVDVVGYLL